MVYRLILTPFAFIHCKIKFGYNSATYDDEGEKTFVKKPDFNKNQLIEMYWGDSQSLNNELQTTNWFDAVCNFVSKIFGAK